MRNRLAAAAVVVVLVLLVYGRSIGFDSFVYDDGLNITKNAYVNQGLTAEGVRKALFEGMNEFWFPVTSFSHMLEVSLFGVKPAVFHATNVALHIVNCLLVLALFTRLCGLLWPALVAAMLYAVHPLSAEPVAWISGRRDLLCALFWLLTLLAYTGYARKPGLARMAGVLALFVLGMASKVNMIAIVPMLLVLDWQPLRRVELFAPGWPKKALWLVLEKAPLVLVGIALASLTVRLQSAMFDAASAGVPFQVRAFNAIYLYAFHVVKVFLPWGLVVQYPYLPSGPPLPLLAGAVLLLLAITALCLWQWRRMPLLLVGWAWYCVALLPAAGLTRVANFLTADRYVYIPMLGVYLILGVLGWALVQARPQWRMPLAAVGAAALALLAAMGFVQGGYWRDNLTLWTHTMAWYPTAPYSLNGYGNALYEANRIDEARQVFERGREAGGPDSYIFNVNLTDVAIQQGRWGDAIRLVQEMHKAKPGFAHGYEQLADALGAAAAATAEPERRAQLEREQRVAQWQARLASGERPVPTGNAEAGELADALYHLATNYLNAGSVPEALAYCEAGGRVAAGDARFPHLMARIYMKSGDKARAVEAYRAALAVDPLFVPALTEWVMLDVSQGTAESQGALEKAYQLQPDAPQIKALYEAAHEQRGK